MISLDIILYYSVNEKPRKPTWFFGVQILYRILIAGLHFSSTCTPGSTAARNHNFLLHFWGDNFSSPIFRLAGWKIRAL